MCLVLIKTKSCVPFCLLSLVFRSLPKEICIIFPTRFPRSSHDFPNFLLKIPNFLSRALSLANENIPPMAARGPEQEVRRFYYQEVIKKRLGKLEGNFKTSLEDFLRDLQRLFSNLYR